MRLALLLALPSAFSAQGAPAYTRGPDTIRFHEITAAEIVVETPKGPIRVNSDHDAIVALTLGRNGTARAWYDSLSLGVRAPTGDVRPETGAALRKPFTLRVDARGRATTVATPAFPESFRGVSDLRLQFDDFFLRLPAAALRKGLTWTDTVSGVHGDRTPRRTTWRRIIRNDVLRDTSVGGVAAVVIGTRQQIHIAGVQPVDNQPLTAHTAFDGTDDGFFVFAPGAGRLLGRRRNGTMQGQIRYVGLEKPLVLSQRMTYRNSLDAWP